MFKPFQLLSLLSVLAVLFAACSKDEVRPTPPPEPAQWQAHPEVRLDKVLCENMFVTDEKLYVAGNNYLLTFNSKHELESSQVLSFRGLALGLKRPCMNKKFLAYVDVAQKITIHLIDKPEISTQIDIKAIDSTFWLPYYTYNQQVAINDQDELLVPVASGNNGETAQVIRFQLFTSPTNINAVYRQSTILATVRTGFTNMMNVLAYQNDFLVAANRGTYQIFPNGIAQKVSNITHPYLLKIKDSTFVMGYAGSLDENFSVVLALEKSPAVWQNYRTSLKEDDGWWRYSTVDNKIMSFVNRNIFQWNLDLTKGKYNIQRISLAGLPPYVAIYDVALFKDKVYITTHNGLFSKPLKDFFVYEKE